jgi:hypothetical protein
MSADFQDALAAVQAYAGGQGVDASERVAADGFERLVYRWPLSDALAAVRDAGAVVAAGATVTLRLPVGGDTTVLRSDQPGRWIAEERDPAEVLVHLAGGQPRAEWTADELLAGGAQDGFAAVTGGTTEVAFDKAAWRAAVEAAVDRSVWIGPSKDSFARWLRETIPEQIAEKLLARPGGLVLLADWGSVPAVGQSTRLAIGGLDCRPAPAVDDDVLAKRLASRGESALLPAWRLLDVDPRPEPQAIRAPMQAAIGLTAARLLSAVVEGGRLRPSATQPTEWTLAATPGAADGDFAALVALVRWVGQDLGEARLEVARDLAARRIGDPAHDDDAEAIRSAAQLAFELHVESDVRESLAYQRELEEAFRALDDSVAEMRAKLADALDGALTKALAGALTITIASLASAKVRGWPATIAGIGLAVYLALSAYNLRHLRDDSLQRLDEAAALARHRAAGLGDTLTTRIESWKQTLRGRANFALAVLVAATIAVVILGIVLNPKIVG